MVEVSITRVCTAECVKQSVRVAGIRRGPAFGIESMAFNHVHTTLYYNVCLFRLVRSTILLPIDACNSRRCPWIDSSNRTDPALEMTRYNRNGSTTNHNAINNVCQRHVKHKKLFVLATIEHESTSDGQTPSVRVSYTIRFPCLRISAEESGWEGREFVTKLTPNRIYINQI